MFAIKGCCFVCATPRTSVFSKMASILKQTTNQWQLKKSVKMDVSKNRGGKPPKWMVYNFGKPLLKFMIWGYHYFWKHLNVFLGALSLSFI